MTNATDDWSDQPTPEDAAIDAVFPTRSGRHDLYAEAMRLVGARHSKNALVSLVNWLLHRELRARTDTLKDTRSRIKSIQAAAQAFKDELREEMPDGLECATAWGALETNINVTIRDLDDLIGNQPARADIEHAERLFAELNDLRTTFQTQHPDGLFCVLQAIAAETRMLLQKFPKDHELYGKLEEVIKAVTRIKGESQLQQYVKGLAFGSTGDWAKIASNARQQLKSGTKAPSSTKTTQLESGLAAITSKMLKSAGISYNWPSYPKLRAVTKPILLVGGMFIPKKLESIYERFGFKLDWHTIDHGNPKAHATVVQRIQSGKVGAIIIVEGFMRHDAYKPIVNACEQYGVPMAYGDKAGVAAIHSAFDTLESKL